MTTDPTTTARAFLNAHCMDASTHVDILLEDLTDTELNALLEVCEQEAGPHLGKQRLCRKATHEDERRTKVRTYPITTRATAPTPDNLQDDGPNL